MKQELEEKIFAAGPRLFRQKDLSCMETCMCWGIDCGDGWFALLLEVTRILEWHNSNLVRDGKPPVEAAQVKEKYGGLRFYLDNEDDFANGVIRLAELIAEKTCDVCGAPGIIREGGWLACRCEEHK